MNQRILSVAVLAASLVTSSAGAFEGVTLADYSGAEIFQRYCSSCHGEAAHGDGPVAPTLKVMVPDLTKIRIRYGEFPAALIRDTIDGRGMPVVAHGTRVMPVWGRELWIEEGADVAAESTMRSAIKRLVEYLRELQVPEPERR